MKAALRVSLTNVQLEGSSGIALHTKKAIYKENFSEDY